MDSFCSKCGAEIPVGSGFCPKCGNMVSMNEGSTIQASNAQTERGSIANNNQRKRQSLAGILSVVFGIVGVASCWIIIGGLVGIIAIVSGIIGFLKNEVYSKGMAVVGIALGAAAFAGTAMEIFLILYNESIGL